jgi:hypothetical protein
LLLSACAAQNLPDGSVMVPDGGLPDAIVYESCTTVCLRPSDCAIAYPADDYCPAGFKCALRFSCTDASTP